MNIKELSPSEAKVAFETLEFVWSESQKTNGKSNWGDFGFMFFDLKGKLHRLKDKKCIHDGPKTFSKEKSGFEWHCYICELCKEEIWVRD